MTQKALLIRLTVLLYIITTLHLLALYFFWYWSIWWYDIVMHFLGGLWVGGMAFFAARFIPTFTLFQERYGRYAYIIPLLAVVVVGGVWEVFEFGVDTFITLEQNDIVDTISDLGMDVSGALAAALYSKMKHI